MNVGIVGLGKLGFPCALAIAGKGHHVFGYDISTEPQEWLRSGRYPHREADVEKYLRDPLIRGRIHVTDLSTVVARSSIILVAVQTPHKPEYEGVTRVPNERADFDYTSLRRACHEVAREARFQEKRIILNVVSTVLPGTCDREIKPLLTEGQGLVYNPYFIAMGTVIADFLYPEFVLVGSDDSEARKAAIEFYRTLTPSRVLTMSVRSAELAKVVYNTAIGMKITLANTVMEICDRLGGADADDVMNVLKQATVRIASPAYFSPGMGDAGGCHPRDQIALSWLCEKLQMAYDPFAHVMRVRERQTDWLADVIANESRETGLPVILLGSAFKAGTNIETGSCAVLLRNLLAERGVKIRQHYDPHVHGSERLDAVPAVYFIATDHPEFRNLELPSGSVVLDPWGTSPERPGVRTRRLGRS